MTHQHILDRTHTSKYKYNADKQTVKCVCKLCKYLSFCWSERQTACHTCISIYTCGDLTWHHQLLSEHILTHIYAQTVCFFLTSSVIICLSDRWVINTDQSEAQNILTRLYKDYSWKEAMRLCVCVVWSLSYQGLWHNSKWREIDNQSVTRITTEHVSIKQINTNRHSNIVIEKYLHMIYSD